MIKSNSLIIISSPSGAGKTSICKLLLQENKNLIASISATTRPRRPKEIEGQDYFFISQEVFQKMVENNEFAENAEIFRNLYGTPKKFISDQISNNKKILFDIDWQGARSLFKLYGKKNITSIFILPPSMEELRRRLQNRRQDSVEVIENRMKMAQREMSHQDEYDHIIINESLEKAVKEIRECLKLCVNLRTSLK
jgi:guanylate kinase